MNKLKKNYVCVYLCMYMAICEKLLKLNEKIKKKTCRFD